MERLSMNDVQRKELAMLKAVVSFFDKRHINYSLYAGTLIGAIRHKGFIPWDDDIDIIVPRPDYERFIELVKKTNNRLDNNIEITSFELGNSEFPYCKAINRRIRVEGEHPSDKYLWVDIFPADGLPNNYQSHFNKVNRRKREYYIKRALEYKRSTHVNSFLKNIARMIIIFKIKNRTYDELTARIIKECKRYPFDTSKYVGCIIWGSKHPGDILKREWFDDYIDVEFEGLKVKAISHYHEYLTNRYGNYMQLPPENQRVSHGIKAWEVESEKNIQE